MVLRKFINGQYVPVQKRPEDMTPAEMVEALQAHGVPASSRWKPETLLMRLKAVFGKGAK